MTTSQVPFDPTPTSINIPKATTPEMVVIETIIKSMSQSNEITPSSIATIESTSQIHETTPSPTATIESTSQSYETTPSATVTIESTFQMHNVTVIPHINATPRATVLNEQSTMQEQITTDFMLTPMTAILVNPEITSSIKILISSQSLLQVSKSTSTGLPTIVAVHTDTVTNAVSTGPNLTPPSFPAHIVGALVGIIMGLLLILIAGCMVAICCIARQKKSNQIVIVEQLYDVAMEKTDNEASQLNANSNSPYHTDNIYSSIPEILQLSGSFKSESKLDESNPLLSVPRETNMDRGLHFSDGKESHDFFLRQNSGQWLNSRQGGGGSKMEMRSDKDEHYDKICDWKQVLLKTPLNPLYDQSSIMGEARDNPDYYTTMQSIIPDIQVTSIDDTEVIEEYDNIDKEVSKPEETFYSEVEIFEDNAKKELSLSAPGSGDPVRNPPDTKLIATNQQEDEDMIYTMPEDSEENDCEDSKVSVDHTIYCSEPIQPSLFTNPVPPAATTCPIGVDTNEKEGSIGKESIYAPVYTEPSLLGINSQNVPELTVQNFRKIKTLGTGNFGKVLLANTVGLSPKDLNMSDTDDNKTKTMRVAVKQLKQNALPSAKEAFNKELRFMSRLNHPNVIRVLGACTKEDSPFIMMEWMKKGDLNEYLLNFDTILLGDSPPGDFDISTSMLTNMSAQIAAAMAYLSSHNFIHRDLATRNCLVGSNLQIKVADFGMSRSLYESHYYVIKGHAVLPVRWMAKECFYGKFSTKTDVWAFGVTMWEIFTLAKDIPYEDMDDKEIAADITKKNGSRKLLEKPKSCPQGMYEIMLKCWANDPARRATFEELHNMLSSLTL